jgi:hypothetical protein
MSGMTEPLLHRTQVDACPEASRRERRSELVQPEILGVQFRALRDRFQIVRKFIFTSQPVVRKTKAHLLSDFAFQAFSLVTNFAGTGSLSTPQ